MQHCKREYCNAGTRQWSQRGIYIRKASKAKNSEQIIINATGVILKLRRMPFSKEVWSLSKRP